MNGESLSESHDDECHCKFFHIRGEDRDGVSMPGSSTMKTTMSESPTRENTMPDRQLRTVSRWGESCQRVPRGRIPCWRNHSGECRGSKIPAGDGRDGEVQFGELHTALRIVEESHNGHDNIKAPYHGKCRNGEPLPESLTMETAESESPTRENTTPKRPLRRAS